MHSTISVMWIDQVQNLHRTINTPFLCVPGLRRAVPLPYSEASQLLPGPQTKGTWTVWASTGTPPTSSQPLPEPPANVCIVMYGTKGVSDPLPLQTDTPSREKPRRGSRAGGKGAPPPKNGKKAPFQIGATDEFKVSGNAVWDLVSKINLSVPYIQSCFIIINGNKSALV